LKKAIFLCNNQNNIHNFFDKGRREKIEHLANLYPEVITKESINVHIDAVRNADVVFSAWGMPRFEPNELDVFDNLKAIFYAAGSVKSFAESFLNRGVIIVSGWQANAIPVSEFTVAQIILSTKGYFRNIREYKDSELRTKGICFKGKGSFDETIGLIGCGAIARRVIKLLKNYNLQVIVYDPYLSDSDAKVLGVEKVNLDDIFKRAYVISNHLPSLKELKGILNKKYFSLMREDATFINTARGAEVVEEDLVSELKKRPSLTALLDVLVDERSNADRELFHIPNVYVTSHIAGSQNNELVRMADFVIEDFISWEAGLPLKYQVTSEMLKKMA
jgi:phosphoglycerate dehydrogenase-like enzyme